MRKVIFAPDSVCDTIGKATSVHIVQANGPQDANMQGVQVHARGIGFSASLL